jgi:hypothetical protein
MNGFGDIVWEKEITVGDKVYPMAFETALMGARRTVTTLANNLLYSDDFTQYPNRLQKIHTVCVTLKSLGFNTPTYLQQAESKMMQIHRYTTGKSELGPQLGCQYIDQPPQDSVVVATNLLSRNGENNKFLFCLVRNGGGLFFRTIALPFDAKLSPDTKIVFTQAL